MQGSRFFPAVTVGFFSITMLISGCGPEDGRPRVLVKGQLVDKGNPVRPDGKSSITLAFVEDIPGNKFPRTYSSSADPTDGSFEVKGQDELGIPKGKYRVKLSSLSMNPSPAIRMLNSRFGNDSSPIVVDVVDDKTPLVIDLSTFKK